MVCHDVSWFVMMYHGLSTCSPCKIVQNATTRYPQKSIDLYQTCGTWIAWYSLCIAHIWKWCVLSFSLLWICGTRLEATGTWVPLAVSLSSRALQADLRSLMKLGKEKDGKGWDGTPEKNWYWSLLIFWYIIDTVDVQQPKSQERPGCCLTFCISMISWWCMHQDYRADKFPREPLRKSMEKSASQG